MELLALDTNCENVPQKKQYSLTLPERYANSPNHHQFWALITLSAHFLYIIPLYLYSQINHEISYIQLHCSVVWPVFH